MKFDWLKEIVGEGYTEEIDAKAASAVGARFVARADFEKANKAKKAAEKQLRELEGQIEQLQKNLKDGADCKARLEALQKQMAEEKAEAERRAGAAVAEARFRARFDELAGENRWRDALTEKAVYAAFRRTLAEEADNGRSDKEIFGALTLDKEYFAPKETAPVFVGKSSSRLCAEEAILTAPPGEERT